MPITTLGVGAAVTPAVIKTGISHYTNRKPRRQKPTAHISYDEGLHLIRSFLLYASHHTVEEVQAFTSGWVPHPSWVRTEEVHIANHYLNDAAEAIIKQLGPEGVKAVGGKDWWKWRKQNTSLKAEWIEMRSDYNARSKRKEKGNRVMMYVHGGAYFFGSVDEHRYQIQRHARKLGAKVFAPRYRLAPQFPFPCGLLDCLAAYLCLLSIHDPTEIVLAGDSAGGGMVLSMLVTLRDQKLPLPAGAVLLSPWVDLTHSFPSLSRTDELDYIPAHGFMQKPSKSWPPPNIDDVREIRKTQRPAVKTNLSAMTTTQGAEHNVARLDAALGNSIEDELTRTVSMHIDGKEIALKDQIQLYTTNQLITHPLVSPVLQPSLGGLSPLLIMVGGGELLRDEQIYVAHKAANPHKYRLAEKWRNQYDPNDEILEAHKPTPVQLQVWDDMCHVTPTLSFTRPAKYMYRSVAQFSAWALARAQHRGIEIADDDAISIISTSTKNGDDESRDTERSAGSTDSITKAKLQATKEKLGDVGKAGDPLPAFKNNMIRQQVDRHGTLYPLPAAHEIPACQMAADQVGVIKEGPVRQWLAAKKEWDATYSSQRKKIAKYRTANYKPDRELEFGDGENPPPSALIRRRHEKDISVPERIKKHWGLGMWSKWGWKHDEKTMKREEEFSRNEKQADGNGVPTISTDGPAEGERARSEDVTGPRRLLSPVNDRARSSSRSKSTASQSRSGFGGMRTKSSESLPRARRRTISVRDEGQTEGNTNSAVDTPPVPALKTEQTSTTVPHSLQGQQSSPVDNALAQDQQATAPLFLPKWKTASHLKSASRDTTSSLNALNANADTRSMRSYNTMDADVDNDNASTMAVFSAPGVTNARPRTPPGTQTPRSSTFVTANNTSDMNGKHSLDLSSLAQDHLSGYDTPTSRLSVERLQSHQPDAYNYGYTPTDGASIFTAASSQKLQSYADTSSAREAGLYGKTVKSRPEGVRSPSAMAVTGVAGVSDQVGSAMNGGSREVDTQGEKVVHEDVAQALRDAKNATDHDRKTSVAMAKQEEGDGELTPQAEEPQPVIGATGEGKAQRPGLYDRADSTFVTAQEKL